jgi:hypothetical protein
VLCGEGCKCGVWGLVCFATSTKEFRNRNIISTIQFAAREEREKRDVGERIVGKREGKQEGSEEENQSDMMPVKETGRQ